MSNEGDSEQYFTASGIPVKRIYTPDDIADFDYQRDLGAPGEPPYTRGAYPGMYRTKLWDVKELVGHDTVHEMNRRFKLMLSRGSTRLAYVPDNPTAYGYDADDDMVRTIKGADIGVMGTCNNSVLDFEDMFRDLPLDKLYVDINTDAATTAAPYFAMYVALFDKLGLDLRQLQGGCHNDLIFAYVSTRSLHAIPPSAAMRIWGDMIEWGVANCPKWVALGTNTGYNVRESAVNAYQELAIGLANAMAFINEVLARGRLKIDDVAWMCGFHMSSERDFFEEIAKFRAGRRMWYKLMTERYHAQDPYSLRWRFHVQTAGSSLTYQQPLNNITRASYQVLAAALGGAQSINANTYVEAICAATDEASLVATRSQQIAQYETNIANVIDPLAGSYYVEWLTNEVEKRAWDYLGKIENQGGLVRAIETGWMHSEVAQAIRAMEMAVESGERKVVGVNCFQMDEELYTFNTLRVMPGNYEFQLERLAKLKRERNNEKVKESLENVREALGGNGNVLAALLEAAKNYATLGEMCRVLREECGEFAYPPLI